MSETVMPTAATSETTALAGAPAAVAAAEEPRDASPAARTGGVTANARAPASAIVRHAIPLNVVRAVLVRCPLAPAGALLPPRQRRPPRRSRPAGPRGERPRAARSR